MQQNNSPVITDEQENKIVTTAKEAFDVMLFMVKSKVSSERANRAIFDSMIIDIITSLGHQPAFKNVSRIRDDKKQ